MNILVIPAIIATLVCFLSFLFSGEEDANGNTTEPNYLITFLVTFCVVAAIAYVFSGDDAATGSMKGGVGSLKAVMREINMGDPDF